MCTNIADGGGGEDSIRRYTIIYILTAQPLLSCSCWMAWILAHLGGVEPLVPAVAAVVLVCRPTPVAVLVGEEDVDGIVQPGFDGGVDEPVSCCRTLSVPSWVHPLPPIYHIQQPQTDRQTDQQTGRRTAPPGSIPPPP